MVEQPGEKQKFFFWKSTCIFHFAKGSGRSYEDLVEFLKEDVYVDYNPRMYDVLRRNCNHFSNELAQFLLHGKQLLPGCRPWR